MAQRVGDRHEGDRHRGARREADAVRQAHHAVAAGHHVGRQRRRGHGHHPVARRQPFHALADRGDGAGAFQAERRAAEPVEQRLVRQQSLRPHDVAEVERGGGDVDGHLARAGRTRGCRHPFQRADQPGPGHLEPARAAHGGARRQAGAQPGHQPAAARPPRFRLVIGARHLGHHPVGRRVGGQAGIEPERAAIEAGQFVGHHPAQPGHRGGQQGPVRGAAADQPQPRAALPLAERAGDVAQQLGQRFGPTGFLGFGRHEHDGLLPVQPRGGPQRLAQRLDGEHARQRLPGGQGRRQRVVGRGEHHQVGRVHDRRRGSRPGRQDGERPKRGGQLAHRRRLRPGPDQRLAPGLRAPRPGAGEQQGCRPALRRLDRQQQPAGRKQAEQRLRLNGGQRREAERHVEALPVVGADLVPEQGGEARRRLDQRLQSGQALGRVRQRHQPQPQLAPRRPVGHPPQQRGRDGASHRQPQAHAGLQVAGGLLQPAQSCRRGQRRGWGEQQRPVAQRRRQLERGRVIRVQPGTDRGQQGAFRGGFRKVEEQGPPEFARRRQVVRRDKAPAVPPWLGPPWLGQAVLHQPGQRLGVMGRQARGVQPAVRPGAAAQRLPGGRGKVGVGQQDGARRTFLARGQRGQQVRELVLRDGFGKRLGALPQARHVRGPQPVPGGRGAGAGHGDEPAFQQLGDDVPRRIRQRDVGADRTRPGVARAQQRARGVRAGRAQQPDPAEAPGHHGTARRQPLVRQHDQQRLQAAVEQRRVDRVAERHPVQRRRRQGRDAVGRRAAVDPGDAAERRTVLQPHRRRDGINGVGGDGPIRVPARGRRVPRQHRRPALAPEHAAGRVLHRRFLHQALAAVQLEGAVRADHAAAGTVRAPLQQQRAADLQVLQLQHGRFGMQRPRRGPRHVDDRRGGQHRHGVDDVVGKPRLGGGGQVRGPGGRRQGVAEAEQRVLAERVGQLDALGGAHRAELLVLPRVARQPAGGERAGQGGSGADVRAGNVAGRGDGGERVEPGGPARQGRKHLAGLPGAHQRFPQEGLQHRLRPDLQHDPRAAAGQPVERGAEQHGLAHVVPPVLGIQLARADRLARDGGDHEAGWRRRHDRAEPLQQSLANPVHGRAVEGILEVEHRERPVLGVGDVANPAQRRVRAGQGDGSARIDGGDRERQPFPRDQLGGGRGVEPQDAHPAGVMSRLLREAAAHHDVAGAVERERPAGPRSGNLADAVAGIGGGMDAPPAQRQDAGDLRREQEWLGDAGVAQVGGQAGIGQAPQHGPAEFRRQPGVHLRHRVAEVGAERQGFLRHAGPLAAIAGKDEGEPAALGLAGGEPRHLPWDRPSIRGEEAGKPPRHLRRAAAGDGDAVGMVLAAMRGGAEQGRQIGVRRVGQPVAPGLREGLQSRGAARRDQQRRRTGRHGVRGPGRRCGAGGRGDHRVRVGAAETERVEAGQRAVPVLVPAPVWQLWQQRTHRRHHLDVQVVEGDARVGHGEVERGRQGAAPEGEQQLEQAGQAARRLQVADVGLHRADRQRAAAAAAERLADRAGLDRVADGGAGAVRLEVAERVRIDVRRVVGVAEQRHLGVPARQGEAVRAAVLVDAGGADDAVDGIAVGQGAAERLEHHDGAALAADVAVGARVERAAASVGRQHGGAGEAHEGLRRQQQVDAADQGAADLPAAQRLAGQVQRHQRGGAGGVDGQAGAAKVEQVGDAVRHGGQRRALHGVRVERRRVGEGPRGEIPRRAADINAHARPGEAGRHRAGILHRLVGEFQQQALLRVDADRLARRNAEEPGVEPVHVRQGARGEGVGLASLARDGMEEARLGPTVVRHLADRVAARPDQVPERVQPIAAGQPASCPDDGDRRLRRHARAASRLRQGRPRRVTSRSVISHAPNA